MKLVDLKEWLGLTVKLEVPESYTHDDIEKLREAYEQKTKNLK